MAEIIEVPISIIVDLFNASEKGCDARYDLLEVIKNYKKKHRKGHVCEGFYLSSNGDLEFSEDLYLEAVYRGKIETYTRSATKSIEELKSSLSMLQHMGEEHVERSARISSLEVNARIGVGEPISEEQRVLLEKLSPLLLRHFRDADGNL